MNCLYPKRENEKCKKDGLLERKNIRMYNARLSAILDELEDYYHYEDYKKRFKLLFEFYQLEELLKLSKGLMMLVIDRMVPPDTSAPCAYHKRINRVW